MRSNTEQPRRKGRWRLSTGWGWGGSEQLLSSARACREKQQDVKEAAKQTAQRKSLVWGDTRWHPCT